MFHVKHERMENKKCTICGNLGFEIKFELKDYFFTNEDFVIIQCKSCGFMITDGITDYKDLGKYYNTSKYLSHEKKEKSIVSLVYNLVKRYSISRKFLLISKESNGKKILEIGCGTGDLLAAFKDKKWDTIGVEPSDSASSYAKEKHGLKIYDKASEVKETDFDVVMLWHVLEHIENLQDIISLIKTKVKKSGRIIIALPNPDSYDAKYYKKYWAGWDVPRHLFHFKQTNIKQLLQANGIEIYKSAPLIFDSYFISMLSEEHKGTTSSLVKLFKTLYIGLKSNLSAMNTNEFSSMIYIARVK